MWQAQLLFKGKLVEYMSQEVRVTPAYSPPSSPSALGDVLMITGDLVTPAELALWQKVYEILEVNVDYWDASQNDTTGPASPRGAERGSLPATPGRTEAEGDDPMSSAEGASSTSSSPLSRSSFPLDHSPSSPAADMPLDPFDLYAGKTIIYPHCKLEQLPAEVIAKHFSNSSESSASMLLFLPPSSTSSSSHDLEERYYSHMGHSRVLRHLCGTQDPVPLPEDVHSGYHLLAPGTLTPPEGAVRKSERRIVRRLEGMFPSQALALFGKRNVISQAAGKRWRYTYGSVDVRKCPVPRSSNLQCVDETGGSLTSMGSDDPLLTASSAEFPLASKFGQVLLAVLVALPLRAKLNLFKSAEERGDGDGEREGERSFLSRVKAHLPNGTALSRRQLSAIAVAHTVAEEVLECTGCAGTSRMREVVRDLQENTSLYARNGSAPILGQMLALIQWEVASRSRQFNFPAVATATKEIQRLCTSVSSLYHTQGTTRSRGVSIKMARAHSCPSPGLLGTTTATSTISISSNHSRSSRRHKEFGRAFTFPSLPVGPPGGAGGVAGCGEGSLPPLRVLQDSIHVLRSHQLRVEDNCYSV